ncbi:hypothetical protein SK128_024975 [Halocaridina rubra]|uniref:Uncharacterized protein n=1 Tax=Halocaridina rubra TaxID=373956 RepID=A0AAN8X4R8_HALRR
MGVSMIGKQRRTPGVLSPREVFFASPPSSPGLMSPTLLSSNATSPSVSQSLPTYSPAKLSRNQKILPHYPGMEYPPVFEPGSYSLCGSPPDHQSNMSQNPSEANLSYSSNELDSACGISQCYPGISDFIDMDQGVQSPISQQFEVPCPDMKPQRSVSVHSTTCASLLPSFNYANPVVTRSPQNLYVSAPTSSRSHHNLFASPGYSANQNIYVVSPTARLSSHQNIYVTSPIATTSHSVQFSTTSPAVYSSRQLIEIPSTSIDGNNSGLCEGSDKYKSSSNICRSEEKGNKESMRPRGPLPKLPGAQTVVTSCSSDPKPHDDDDGEVDGNDSAK